MRIDEPEVADCPERVRTSAQVSTDLWVVPAACPIGWSLRDRHGYSRTDRRTCRPGLQHVTLIAETSLIRKRQPSKIRPKQPKRQLTVRSTDGRDWTQYVITGPDGESEPLRKRQAILTMVTTLRGAGVPAREIAKAIPPSRFLSVEGTLDGPELREAFVLTYPKGDPGRWFMENPIHDEERTWIVTKMWGRNTEPVLERLTKLAPEQSGIGYEAVRS
jgi:hypothetical protein